MKIIDVEEGFKIPGSDIVLKKGDSIRLIEKSMNYIALYDPSQKRFLKSIKSNSPWWMSDFGSDWKKDLNRKMTFAPDGFIPYYVIIESDPYGYNGSMVKEPIEAVPENLYL